MWKRFLSIVVSGASMGVAFPLQVLRSLPADVALWFPGVLLGVAYAFAVYRGPRPFRCFSRGAPLDALGLTADRQRSLGG
jgi:hypothetical protein